MGGLAPLPPAHVELSYDMPNVCLANPLHQPLAANPLTMVVCKHPPQRQAPLRLAYLPFATSEPNSFVLRVS